MLFVKNKLKKSLNIFSPFLIPQPLMDLDGLTLLVNPTLFSSICGFVQL
jgi:hypothetical protein